MKCENFLCIYNKDVECLLEIIELDHEGRCADCILADIPEEWLSIIKKDMREKLFVTKVNL